MEQNGAESSRIKQNGAEWSRMEQNRAESSRIEQNGAESSRMEQNGAANTWMIVIFKKVVDRRDDAYCHEATPKSIS